MPTALDYGEFADLVPAADTEEPQPDLGEFDDLVPKGTEPTPDLGEFSDLVPASTAPSSTPETDKAVKHTFSFLPQSAAQIESADSKIAQEAGSKPLVQLPRIEYGPDDSQRVIAEKAVGNTLRDFISGASSAEGIAGILLPPYGIAQMIASAPHVWDEVKQSEKTPPGSPERWEAGTKMVALIGTVAGGAKAMVRPEPVPKGALEAPVRPATAPEAVAPSPVAESLVSETARVKGGLGVETPMPREPVMSQEQATQAPVETAIPPEPAPSLEGEIFGFGPGAAAAGELPPWRASATAMQERINNLFSRQRQARTPESATRETLRVADKWLEADRDAIRTELLDFSKNLPLDERAKFLPAITSAMRRPPIFTRDPDIMYRRAENVLNRMTEKVYDVRKSEVSTDIEQLLSKVEKSPSITVTEKQAIRERGKTFANLKDKMSLDMLEQMQVRMKEIEQTGQELFTLDQVMKQERVNATLREIQAQGTRKVDLPEQARLALGETEGAWQRRINQLRQAPSMLRHFNLSLTPMDWVFQTFDKKPRGALYKTMKVPVDVRYGEWLDSSHAYKERLSKVAEEGNLNAGNFDRIYANAELRQEGGLENLQALGYSDKEIISARTLTRPELKYLRESDTINNELFPVLQDVLAKSFNQEVQKVQGYFPRQRDWDYYNTLSIEEGKFARAMNRTNTEKGFTVSRVGATTKNVTNAHQVMMNHIDDVLYHIKLGPEIRRIADVVRSKEFADSTGSWGQKEFSDWVDVLSRNGGVAAGRRIHALDVLRKNVGVAQLAFRLTTTALQPISIIQGMAVASPRNMSVSLSRMALKSHRDFMLENFPEIRARVGDDPAYSDYGGSSIRDKFARGGFKAISVLDRFAAMTVGEAAYRDSLSKRGIPFDLKKADPVGVQDAQLAVRKTQSSAYAKDVPLAISRGNFSGNASVDKAIFQFQNFLVNKWALVKNGALQMGIEEKSPVAGARIMTFLVLGTIAEQLSRDGIARVIQTTMGTSPYQDKEAKEESDKSYALKIGEKAAVDLVTSMPVVTNIAGMAKYEGIGIPVMDTLGNVIEGATKVVKGKKPETKAVGAIRSAQAVGALAGVPTGQVADLAVQGVRANIKTKPEKSSGRKPLKPVKPSRPSG